MSYKRRRILVQLILTLFLLAVLLVGVSAQAPTALPLSEPGPFLVGTHQVVLTDASREDRRVVVKIWYPASAATIDAAPLLDEAPYPVIVYSHGGGGSPSENGTAEHLSSYGFVVIGVSHHDDISGVWVDRPMDIFLALDEMTRLNESGDFEGVADLAQLGLTGWSLGGATTIQLAGARLDRAYHAAWCVDHANTPVCPRQALVDVGWNYMTSVGQFDENGLWYLPSEWQFDAAVTVNPGLSPIFGDKGLTTATIPILQLSGYLDQEALFQEDQVFLFEHLGSADKSLITWIEVGHQLPAVPESMALQVKHFLVAFFGYHLQGREEYAEFLTEDYVNSIEGLHWGVYSE
ncbi:MAG: hypothetical protein BroJett018_26640 [Chloroflexota bacterium]|nr:MAG: hypothetical protein BroJett018_26640 [Chloroflexota bacterium]